MAEHGDADRNANSGRGIHGIDGFADVADEAARAAIVQSLSDRGRVVFQTGGTRPGRYIADGVGGWEWLGLPDADEVAYDNSGSGLASTDAQGAIDELTSGVVSALASASAAIHVNVPGEISGITEKATPVSADLLVIEDSADSNNKKRVQIGNLPGGGGTDADAIHDNVAGEIAAITAKSPLVGADIIVVEDSAAANAKKSATVADIRITESQITDLDHTDPNAIHDNVAAEISAVTEKVTPVAADLILIEDSADSNNKKRVQVGNLPGGSGTDADAIHDNVAGEIAVITEKATPISADLILIEDSADSNNKKRVQVGNLPGATPVEHVKLVAVGGANAFVSDDEGQNWTQLTPGFASGLVSLFSIEKGTYVVAGTSGDIYSSVNGTDWVQRTPPASYAGTYSFGFYSRYHKKFFLGGEQGVLHYSYDGIFWSAYDFTGDALMEFGAFSGMDEDEDGLLVAADNGNNANALVYSSDGGATWSQYDTYSGAATRFNDVTKVPGGNWVAVFADEFDAVAYSANGKDWTDVDIGEDFVNDAMRFVSYIPSSGRVVTAGSSSSPFYSDDGGVTWSAGSFDGSNFDVLDGGYSPFWDAIFVVGQNGEVQITRDGTTWSSVPVGVGIQLNGVNAKSLGDLDPQRVVAGGGGSGTDADAIHDNVAGEIAAITAKSPLVGADIIVVEDSAAANAKKSATVADIRITESQITDLDHTDPNAIHDSVAGEIAAVTSKATLVGADTILVEDSAAANAKKSATIAGIRITESQITDLDHTDPDAVHVDVAGEIAALTVATLSGSDHVLIEDADDSNNKKRVLASEFFGSGTDPNAIHDNVASEISAVTAKATPVAGDFLLIEDSEAANVKKRITIGDLPGGGSGTDNDAIHDNVAGEIAAITEKVTPVAADLLVIEDSADSNNKKRVQVGNLPGGGGVSLLTPDNIVAGMEFFDDAGRVLSGSNLTSWVSDSTNMTLTPVSADPPVRNSGAISGFTAVADPRTVPFGEIGIDDFVEMTSGNGLSGGLDGAPWSTSQDIYIGMWCQLLGTAGCMFAVESLALAFNGSQLGAFIRRNSDGLFAKGRRSIPEVMDGPGYLEMFYRRGVSGLDAVSGFAFNGILLHNSRAPTGLDYTLSIAPSNLYIGTDTGVGTGDGNGSIAVKKICLINNYMPTQTERMQLFNWAGGNTFLAK